MPKNVISKRLRAIDRAVEEAPTYSARMQESGDDYSAKVHTGRGMSEAEKKLLNERLQQYRDEDAAKAAEKRAPKKFITNEDL